MTMLDAFHLAAVGTRSDMQLAARDAQQPGTALLRAVIAQCDGDVEGAVRILRRELSKRTGSDRAAVADTLAPILVMRRDKESVMTLARIMDEGGWIASACAFRALIYAETGNRDSAQRQAAAAHRALSGELDEVLRTRVLQRLARTAYYLHEHEKALDLALTGANLCFKMSAWRGAAAGYSIAYNVHTNVTGDVEEADRYAQLWHRAAIRSEDESYIHPAQVAEYELAVQFADVNRIKLLED